MRQGPCTSLVIETKLRSGAKKAPPPAIGDFGDVLPNKTDIFQLKFCLKNFELFIIVWLCT